jgi:two-component system response regulator AtoC
MRAGRAPPFGPRLRAAGNAHPAMVTFGATPGTGADLYYRLGAIMLEVPPLRQRDGDVLWLAQHFLASLGQRYGRPGLRLSAEAGRLAQRHAWPGNVRELRNVMEQAVLSADGEVIEIGNLAIAPPAWRPPRPAEVVPGAIGLSLTEIERLLIAQALEQNDGNVTRAARELGISRDTLRYRLGKQARR